MNIALLIIAIVELIILVTVVVLFYLRSKERKEIVDNAENIVKGKLNIDDISTVKLSGDTEVIASGLNSIKTNLLTFVESTKQNVVVLADAVDALTESMKNNQNGNEMIAGNSVEVEEKTMRQLELVQDNLRVIESNSAKMQEMVSSIDVITEMLNETVHMSEDGITYLEGYERDMDVVSDDLKEINDTLASFNDEIRQIYDVGDFIVGISNQLKLLSFNASIEAARAGQSGRGFSVVADEMTGMSEQTREGMGRINEILEKVMHRSKDVTNSIQKCTDTYNYSKETFKKVNTSFRTINDKSFDIKGKINDMAGMINDMAENSEQAKVMADDLYESAQKINEKTGDMSAISQEVAAEAIHIGEKTQALNGMLQGIQKLLKRFSTGTIPTQKSSGRLVKIAMISMYDNDFWYGVRRGANYAITEMADLNVHIEFIPVMPQENSKDQDKFIADTLTRLIAEQYDGIIYPGFLSGIDGILKRAKENGIKLMTFNCDSSNKMLREACLWSDSIAQGEVCAKAAMRLVDSPSEVLILTGNPEVQSNIERSDGFKKTIAGGKQLTVADEIYVADDGDDVYRKALDYLKSKKPEIIYLTSGYPLSVAKAIVDAGANSRTKLVGYDLTPALFPYIRSGVIGAVISQDSFGQGHDPIVWMYNHIVTGEDYPSEYINCRLSIADAGNIDDLIEG